MPTVPIDPVRPDPATLDRAAAILCRGGLVAFPTETVYGLGAHALHAAAIRRVFAAKGRPAYNPLIIHVADLHQARRLVRRWPPEAQALATAFWPGPLTLVLPRGDNVPDLVTAGLPAVALRVPAHPVALGLIRAARLPVVAPSANRSGAVSPTRAGHVVNGLGDRVDLILDGGETALGIESTVVDLSGDEPLILRPGALPATEIERHTGPLGRPGATDGPPRHASPGLLDRHYAPRARLVLFDDRDRQTTADLIRAAVSAGQIAGGLLLAPLDAPLDRAVSMPGDPEGYARRLYAELHEMDAHHCDLIVVERVPEGAAWEGVRDRLRRAAAD
jgi:L-threonylcarbamoyladenylate synthase